MTNTYNYRLSDDMGYTRCRGGTSPMKVYSDIIQFRGNHYDFGYEQGIKLKNSILMDNRFRTFSGKKSRRFTVDPVKFKQVIHTFSPHIALEIQGLQDALQLDDLTAIEQFGGYFTEYGKSGCSIYTDQTYMVRNYDNAPDTYEGRIVLYQPTDVGYATIGPTMQITGRTDGMNEKGLSMGYNFVNRKQSEDGFVCNMIGRLILEQCATVDEAITLIKQIPHRNSFTYVLSDPTQAGAIVEASPRNIAIRHGNICTNHFDILTEENRYRMDDSFRRIIIMNEAKENIVQPMDAYHLMNDLDKGIFATKYGAWSGTLHTALYETNKRLAGFTIGANKLPYMIDFGKWVTGENIYVKRINGQINASIPFAHMQQIK